MNSVGKYARYGSYGEDEATCVHEANDVQYIGLTSFKMPSMVPGYEPLFSTGDNPKESTYNTHNIGGDLSYHICAAMLRMILKETFNYDVDNQDVPLGIISNGPGIGGSYVSNPGFRIDFVYCDTDDEVNGERGAAKFDVAFRVYSNFENSTSGASNNQHTFRSLARLIAHLIGNNFIARSGAVTNRASRPNCLLHGYYVTTPDGLSITNAGDNLGRLPYGYKTLHDRYFKCYSRAELCLQNISPASDAAALADAGMDADRIDSVALRGRIYKFKDPFPRVKQDNMAYLLAGNTSGYTIQGTYNVNNDMLYVNGPLPNASTLMFDMDNDGVIRPKDDLQGPWFQLPDRDQFSNCTGVSPFYQRPGGIRKFNLYFDFDGDINTFLKRIYLSTTGTIKHRTRFFGRELGTSLLIAAEKEMSVTSANLIKHNVQVCYYAGAYFKKRRATVMSAMKSDVNSTKNLIITDNVLLP